MVSEVVGCHPTLMIYDRDRRDRGSHTVYAAANNATADVNMLFSTSRLPRTASRAYNGVARHVFLRFPENCAWTKYGIPERIDSRSPCAQYLGIKLKLVRETCLEIRL